MRLTHGIHLAYCTNIHRGETWEETFDALSRHTLAVRDKVCPKAPYAIGLRLSHQAACTLSEPKRLTEFQRWLDDQHCYVFTINGFPYGQFHGRRVKEQVYAPDWTTEERVDYTNRLFDLLGKLVPKNTEGSVSTVPCSYKEFITTPEQVKAMRNNLWRCVEHVHQLSEKTGRTLHLGLEPEPLCYLETSDETVEFINQMRDDRPGDARINQHLGVNYDTCHLAVEFETAAQAISKFRGNDIMISKMHLSSALAVQPRPDVRQALAAFADDIYFHQVVERSPDGQLKRYKDLDIALASPERADAEWRIHFHIPLHSAPTAVFGNTSDHILDALDLLQKQPGLCRHLEMETYTWEVMPPEMKNRNVVDQLISEYNWALRELAVRGFTTAP